MHLPPIPRFLARFVMRLIIVVVFIGLPGALIYLRQVGIGFGQKERVAEALSSASFHTTIGKLLFDPFRGLIAQQIEISETSGEKRNLAMIEQVVISLSLSELLARKVSIDLIELRDTDVSIPLGSQANAPRLSLGNVEAELIFLVDQVRISHFEANVQGVRVSLSGMLKNPQSFHLEQKPPENKPSGKPDTISHLADKLLELKYPGQPPDISAEVSGDLADLKSLKFSPISIRSGPIEGDGWRIESVDASAEYVDGRVTIDRMTLRDGVGVLLASGKWADGMVSFEMTSSLSPEPLRALLPKDSPVRKLEFASPPEIDVHGQIALTTPLWVDVTGSVRCEKFSFREVQFNSFASEFVYRDGRLFARGVRLQAEDGELLADVMYGPGDFRVRIDNSMVPTILAPLLGEKEQEFLSLMEFKDNPSVQLELQGPKPDFAVLRGEGTLKLGRTAMRGAWMDSVQSKLTIADRAVTYRDFSVSHGRSTGTGTFVYDFGRQEVRLSNIASTMNPVDVMMWIDPKIADAIRPFRFRQPPKASGGGTVHMKDPKKTDLSLKVSAEGVDYDLLNKTLNFGRTIADVDIVGTKVLANVKSARLLGGDVGIKAVVSTDPADPTFSSDVDVRRVNFAKLTKLYFDYDDSLGLVSGQYKFSARFNQEEKMRGVGTIRVQEGNVFAIPILGPLSDIISKIIPGSGYQNAKSATADFQIADEKITTKNLKIEGAGFSLFGKGDILFMKDKMDLSVRINARGIPGLVFFPVSKLFEYVSTGSPSEPAWRPKIIPRFGNDTD